LEIIKTVDNNQPEVGDNVTFTLTVSNNGPDDSTNVVVTDILKAGFTYAGVINGGDTRDDSSPTGTGLTWTINSLPAGAAPVVLSFVATVLAP